MTVGINQLARAAKVKPEETRRLMGFLSRMRFLTFSRGRAALTPGGLASVASGMRLPD